jgi:hypothetical protein
LRLEQSHGVARTPNCESPGQPSSHTCHHDVRGFMIHPHKASAYHTARRWIRISKVRKVCWSPGPMCTGVDAVVSCLQTHRGRGGSGHSHGHGKVVNPVQGQNIARGIERERCPKLGVVTFQAIWRLLPPARTKSRATARTKRTASHTQDANHRNLKGNMTPTATLPQK